MDDRDRAALTLEIRDHERELARAVDDFYQATQDHEDRLSRLKGMIADKKGLLGIQDEPEDIPSGPLPQEPQKRRGGRPRKQ